jgi:O-antigen/teichoic acid export membrane protein
MLSGHRIASAKSFRVFVAMVLFATVFVVTELLSLIGPGPWASVGHLTALIAIAGAIYGTVIALDSRSGAAVSNHSAVRVALCAIFGAVATYILLMWHPLSFSIWWSVIGAIVGASMGWYGWRWAKYINF